MNNQVGEQSGTREKENKFIRLATDEINIICEKLCLLWLVFFSFWLLVSWHPYGHFYLALVFSCVQIVSFFVSVWPCQVQSHIESIESAKSHVQIVC